MIIKTMQLYAAGVVLAAVLTACSGAAHATSTESMRARGRYLVVLGGCNDCHTPGYAQAAGRIPEKAWLTGSSVGWNGPWGTSFPVNLRLLFAGLTEPQWLKLARTMTPKPPMPWFDVRAMTDSDLKAIYVFVRSLGPTGKPAPKDLPPGATPAAPYNTVVLPDHH